MVKIVIRLLAGLILPIYVGTTLVCGVLLVQEAENDVRFLELPVALLGGFIFFPFGVIYVGVQSVVYTFLMEFLVNPLIKNHVLAVSASVLLGAVSGIVWGAGWMMLVGAVVGLLTGLFLRSIYRVEPQPDA